MRHIGSGPTVAKFTEPGELKTPAELMLTHLYSGNPTPIENWKRQAKDSIQDRYPGSKILEEKDLTVAGKKAYRLMFVVNDIVQLKTVIHRTNLEYFLLDAAFPQDRTDKIRPLIEASVATFEIVPLPLSEDEKLSDARTTALIKAAKIDPALLGERWYAVHVPARKVGHTRFKMTESEGMYSFESDTRLDFGDGNTDSTSVRGSYSPDGRVQKVETEETKVNPKQKWVFRATAMIQSGQAKMSRDLNGVKEERTVPVEEGVLLTDVGETMRAVLVAAGKGSYLLKSLSPYSEEWKVELVDVGGPETLEVDGRTRNCVLVQCYVGRRKNVTCFYGPDRWVIRVGGHREILSIRESTKEEAQK
ncbi:MAG: hypothetical protein HY293_16715 [Planctomycetes bacterium]|nr:hypothetical protein [Planctomycetota bacterium]